MPSRIEDYALLGDTHTAALVARNGSIDWLCVPRFDGGACFAALLGESEHGRWLVAPTGAVQSVQRRYRGDSLVLETDITTADGSVRLIDFMPPRARYCHVVRIVEGLRGRLPMEMELVVRFDYGAIVPWARRVGDAITFIAGPDALALRTPVRHRGVDFTTRSEFTVAEGDRVPFVLSWYSSVEDPPGPLDAEAALADTLDYWGDWLCDCTYAGEWAGPVHRSLITLKALTYQPTGGIVAAATTSLPEELGGVRNWDYRYCWLRDATFTLYALMLGGFEGEAQAWRDWLLRAVAGEPSALQIMYGPAGERRLPEVVLDWLPGYEGSAPVRQGNAAHRQFQLDVWGEVMDAMHQSRKAGIEPAGAAWDLQRALLAFLETAWTRPDEGIWEVRGPRRHFTHSKVMAWVAFDRAVKGVERHGLPGPVERWRALRDEVHEDVCTKGYNAELGSFTQYYGSTELDASLLMIPLVGFLPATDPRMKGTVEAIERELLRDGFVMRYSASASPGPDGAHPVDGLPGQEGAFLACSFWLADNLMLLGRTDDAEALFRRLLALCNDVGLLSEEYDPESKRLLGNFPQAFSHVSLVNTAVNLARGGQGLDRRG
ncbi:MAG TPA: glycoside hydrolase family 15 protein [Acidimicrobiales bacterium]|nr:glycoside hydrolase family 15 protein [Acidimicrobiales bacterium]